MQDPSQKILEGLITLGCQDSASHLSRPKSFFFLNLLKRKTNGSTRTCIFVSPPIGFKGATMCGSCVLILSHTVNEGTLALGQQWILGQLVCCQAYCFPSTITRKKLEWYLLHGQWQLRACECSHAAIKKLPWLMIYSCLDTDSVCNHSAI